MLLNFKNKKISSIITALPKNESFFDDEIQNYNFSAKKCTQLKELMGYNKHRVAPENMCASDLAYAAFKKMLDDGAVAAEDIDVLLYVTQSHDYIMPQTSTILQHRLSLKKDILCFDLSQGCAGFIHGLFQAFLLLENPAIKTVAVVNADVLSRKTNPKDRNSYPLVGDAASVCIVENTSTNNEIYCYNKTFGEESLALNIPAGGFKMPCSELTRREEEQEDGNIRSLENLVMKGASVFSFVQEHVPQMLNELLKTAQLTKDEIDYYIFHQPNKFMLQKLADKIGVSYNKMPNNIVENFGNASGVTIPTNICFNLKDILAKKAQKICFGGFGVGLTLAGIIMNVDTINYCQMIDV